MNKIIVSKTALGYPMPVTLVGAMVEGKPNFLAVAWISKVNGKPPLVGVSINRNHYTGLGIEANKTFSVCVPGKSLVIKTDYCGVVSGKNVDKSRVFSVFYGELKTAPMIEECPVCMECRLYQTVELPSHQLFIGEVVNVYSEDKYMSEGNIDIGKVEPFFLSKPDDNYWSIGEKCGKAYKIGFEYKEG